MRFECTKDDLLEKVQIVQKGVSTRSTLPILTGILFNVEDNNLFLSSTDLEMSIRCKLEVNAQSPGSVVIPARLIGDVLRNLPDALVKINSNTSKNQVEIECESARFNIKVLPPEDFPKIPDINKEKECTVDGKLFINAIKQIIRAASRDETRPILTGILFTINEDKIKMVATDSYRLAIKELSCKNKISQQIKMIVPARVLDEIIKIVPQEEFDIKITVAENQIAFDMNNIIIITRLIEGEFPKYQQLLPESYQFKIGLNKESLLGATRRASILAINNAPIKVSIGDKKLRISAQSSDVGEATEELDIKEDQEPITIAFNAQYLLDGLQSVGKDEFVLEVISPLNPALLRTEGENDFIYLIMPVRIGA